MQHVDPRTLKIRALTMLNERGDVTVLWEEKDDAAMEKVVEALLEKGCVFFIIEPRFGGAVAPERRRLSDVREAFKNRSLSIPNEYLAEFVASGAGLAVPTPDEPVRRSRKSKDAKEIAANESVGMTQMKGG